jgi:hypothetical protein
LAVTAGVWTGNSSRSLGLAAGTNTVGDISYTDLEGTAFWRAGRAEFQGSLGARGGRGGGRGVYGEASMVLALSSRLGLTVAGGRYPTDPARGTIAGRYASVGVRWSGSPAPERQRPEPAWTARAPIITASGTNGHLAEISIAVESSTLVVMAPAARLVEIMGDFTDWQPVALTRKGTSWHYRGPVPSGLRRLNVRVDGGPWSVPTGATIERDDFDEVVGLIVVP